MFATLLGRRSPFVYLPGALLALALAAAPALCGAQSDPASPPDQKAAGAPPQSGQGRNFFDWLFKPAPPKWDAEPAPAGTPVPGSVAAPSSAPAGAPPAPAGAPPAPASAPPAPASAPPAPAAAVPAVPQAVPAPPPAADPPAPPVPAPPAPVTAAPAAPVPRSGMALILPAKADGFARAAEVTRKGFMAAREVAEDKPVVQLIETDGSAAGALAAYQEALAKNVAVIVGPLTKTEVAAVIKEPVVVPTLLLNTPDGAVSAPRGLYMLSLSTELEAQVVAEAAYRPDAGVALVVATTSPLSKRASAAFQEAWTRQGGVVKEVIEFTGNLARVKRGVDAARANVVFLAADAERARVLRPFLGRHTVVIATSQVYAVPRLETPAPAARPAAPDAPAATPAPAVAPVVAAPAEAPAAELQKVPDLNGLRFVDMPWLLQPDHPATMVYARPEPALPADLARLYALGIDAFRVAQQLARQRGSFEIDGVTGRLVVNGGLIERTPVQAEYRDGVAVLRDQAAGTFASQAGR